MAMPDPAPGAPAGPTQARRVSNYRRRRPLPAIVLFAVLGLIATVVWIRTLDNAREQANTACAPPTAPATALSGVEPAPAPGQVLAAGALDDVDPLPPDAVKVKVLNANGERGVAARVAAVLTADLGFGAAGEPDRDLVYPNYDLNCHSQIRFGAAGSAAGRTLGLVVPCAELVRDDRADDTVDLAIGARFESLDASAEAREILRQLTTLAAQPNDPAGGQQGAPSTVDPALLARAQANSRC